MSTTVVWHQESRLAGRRGELHVHRWSPAESPRAVLLLLHGLGEHAGQYASLAETAAGEGIETWAPDQAGHGHSAGVRVLVESVDYLVADAETVLAEARRSRPGLPVMVVGHSLGAVVAALLVGEIRGRGRADPAADVAGLVLTGSALRGGPSLPPGIDPWLLRKDPGELVRDPDQAARVRADPLVWAGGLRRETLSALVAATARTAPLLAEGALDHLPVLLLHSEADDLAPVAGAREVAAALPRGRIVTYPEDRHNVLHELDRATVHAELLRFAHNLIGASPA
ncbi:putative Lysophospholipase, Monoglyceride lipase [Pseudonocardia sp. Ae406_Ps2]|uniref:alpha/beta fold hydrolase n=1 Tax=unclassified Pseudonocardia TaxID=2619320 RepID=UPI00094B2639|nr:MULTISPECIES: alpha/beta fold hydrolase [unclassified Pseudonocardia]OLM01298.1 putative Lysophospholipase, Monoglyceride lipase [Pseudonocardia sp. Ae406_Ps2]OLM06905.1 putative Lysophospholipase, Monoglyceride lipase [Pseudonocardia sp. Ae331_Ps2]OLM14081.1 putative Lysophospholipase, Monoglyceride lipase [Pseudonocardia sp. Ae505_Ps2]OLM22871.1 putative Lysophospholipase, Monoglyceride lipase [Pseudonocardia sp. Ae706_Ps2]OLM31259.1 putative Lysophospholipase, Monoglyceride lipase [Pseud